MRTDRTVDFYHAPNTRSGGTRALLEELQADVRLHVLDLKAGDNRSDDYLAINPMGKVPTVVHDGAVVTEQVAVMLYLADLYADKGLAPALDDPLRGPYLRWMVYYAASFEPAVVDSAMKREPAQSSTSPYGTYQGMLDILAGQLEAGPWMLGERFTAADVLWGTALNWTIGFGLVPEHKVFRDYVDRVLARPAMQRAAKADAELAEQAAS